MQAMAAVETDTSLGEKVRRIAKAGYHAPTLDNSQQWRFEWHRGEKKLRVYLDAVRGNSTLDPKYVSKILQLGFLMESVDIAASAEGLTPTFELFNLPSVTGMNSGTRPTPDKWLEISFREGTRTKDPMHEFLYERCSDRRVYAGGSASDPVYGELLEVAKPYKRAKVYVTGKLPLELDTAQWILRQYKPAWAAISHWFRFTDEEAEMTRDGISWRASQMPRGLANAVFKSFPLASIFLRIASRRFAKVGDPFMKGSAARVCITATPDAESMIECGRLSLRLWLHMTSRKYAVRPVPLPAVLSFLEHAGQFHAEMPAYVKKCLDDSRTGFAKAFGFKEPEMALFVFDSGLPPGRLPDNARSLRRDISLAYSVVG